ncbi:MAG: 50S ribosomal protein L4 [Candidatus Karelsulcia muelleri]|uniref:50S ribosomal protein L4 n=1 Tax=Candidatus Karelsulcia muelleri TaxID=336810 RepID=UPI000D7C3152|nr:50S ribosomal protein L4 [Candidatus Karelsulcia muelleri]
MKLNIINKNGFETGRFLKIKNDSLKEKKNHIIYLEIKRYFSAQRQGTKKSKERSEITGSTKKIQRQKGSGNARKGNIKNPLFRSGGRIFGPKPKKFNFKLNKLFKVLAKKLLISFKIQKNKVKILEDFFLKKKKTFLIKKLITTLNLEKKKLLIIINNNKKDKNFFIASRNLKLLNVISIEELNIFYLANYDYLIFFESVFKKLFKLFNIK